MSKLCAFAMSFCLGYSSIAVCATKPEIVYGNKSLSIRLQANPTTGYQWQLSTFDKDVLHPQRPRFIAPNTNLMGAPGVMVFSFIPQKTNVQTRVCFRYQRSWEKDAIEKLCVDVRL